MKEMVNGEKHLCKIFFVAMTVFMLSASIDCIILKNKLNHRPTRIIVCYLKDGVPLTFPDECKEK